MSGQQVAGIVRAVVSGLGGYLVGKGLVDADTVVSVAGAASTVAMALWSVYSKRQPKA